MEIGSKLKELRLKNGLTLSELASRSEVTKGFLSQLERNLTSPNISTLEDILEALGTNLQEFFQSDQRNKLSFVGRMCLWMLKPMRPFIGSFPMPRRIKWSLCSWLFIRINVREKLKRMRVKNLAMSYMGVSNCTMAIAWKPSSDMKLSIFQGNIPII